MGLLTFVSKLLLLIWNTKVEKTLLLGLDNAGKTTFINQLRNLESGNSNDPSRTFPTIGVNMTFVMVNNTRYSVWDLAGQARLRKIWESYFEQAIFIVYIIDLADEERFAEALTEFESVLTSEKLSNVTRVTVILNKFDLLLSEGKVAAIDEYYEHESTKQLVEKLQRILISRKLESNAIFVTSLRILTPSDCVNFFNCNALEPTLLYKIKTET